MRDDEASARALGARERARALISGIREASALYGVSRLQIVARLVWLWRNYGFRPGEAHHEGLTNPRLSPEHLAGAIPEDRLIAIQRRVNLPDLVGLIEDKAVFYLFCRGAGLPIPTLLGLVDGLGGWMGDGTPFREPQDLQRLLERVETDVFVKPAGTGWGIGVRAYARASGGFRDVVSGAKETAASLSASLASSPYRRMVLQERLRNHRDIEHLTGTETLQTVRIQTVLTSGRECVMGGCLFKFASSGQIADNIVRGTTGNFFAGVTLETGVLRAALRYRASEVGLDDVVAHPRTGLPIAGFRLPWWEETRALVRRAAALFAPLTTIGWDVGLTPGGPVLVEGNLRWSPWNALAACRSDETYAREMAGLLGLLRAAVGR